MRKKYEVRVTVRQLVSDAQLAQEDRDINPQGEWNYSIFADSPETALFYALDRFHENVPVHTLEHYDISAEVIE